MPGRRGPRSTRSRAQRAHGGRRARGTRTAELAELAANVERELAEVSAREAAAVAARTEVGATQQAARCARAPSSRTRRTEIATADAQLEALARRRDEAARRLRARDRGDRAGARALQGRSNAKASASHHELAALRQTKLDLGSHAEAFELRRAALADDVARGEAEVETLRTELHRRRSRLTSLQELQQRYEGFQRGTRMVMQQAARDRTDDAAQIRGLVADVVRAPEQLEVAVEAVLGDRLGGVLVDEPAVGVAAIGFLKQAGGGRSAFVPMAVPMAVPVPVPRSGRGSKARAARRAGCRRRGNGPTRRADSIEVEDRTQLVAAMTAMTATTGEGVLGRMADLVGFADGYEQVGKRLLGGTVVVDGLERALALHGEGVTDRLVTLDGDVVAEDGVVAGGSRDAQGAGVLAQKREIRDLDEIVGKLEHDLGEAMQRLVTAKTELAAARQGARRAAHASASGRARDHRPREGRHARARRARARARASSTSSATSSSSSTRGSPRSASTTRLRASAAGSPTIGWPSSSALSSS